MSKFCASLLAWLSLLWAATAHAQLGLSPGYFDLSESDARRTQSFQVTNFGEEAVRIAVELVPFDIDADGKVVELEPHARSLEKHLAISPVEFEIPPRGHQVVRFSLRPVEQLESGEYRQMVYFRLGGRASIGSEGSFPIAYRLGGAVYVQVGEPKRSATLDEVSVKDGATLEFGLRSTGTANARMRGRYAIWTKESWGKGRDLPPRPSKKEPAPEGLVASDALPGRPVLPGKSVRYEVALFDGGKRLPAGEYVLHVSGLLEGEQLERVVPFRVAADRR